MPDIPDVVVENFRGIANGKHRGCAGQVDAIIGKIHVTPTFVNGRHQTLLVSCSPIDGVEIRIVDYVVV